MKTSLLPERPLIISPTLAATIGLEEAVMLQVLAELIHGKEICRRRTDPGLEWAELTDADLERAFPFWAVVDIRRVQNSLQNLGLIVVDPVVETGSEVRSNFYAIDEPGDANRGHSSDQFQHEPSRQSNLANQSSGSSRFPHEARRQPNLADRGHSSDQFHHEPSRQSNHPYKVTPIPANGGASLIEPNWQPGLDWIKKCQQHSIPEEFIQALVPEFVGYWRDRAQARFSWGNAFYKHVLKEWRNEQTRKGAFERATEMSAQWRPSQDAIGILEISGINSSFIEDAIPEFVLYWRERGMVNGAWNTKFIEHIRRQWAKFSASFGYDDTPKTIPEDWQPSSDCFEILQLAEIDEEYARNKIPEFVMYWKDSQQVKSSWNTVFLQFIKQDWARQLKQSAGADLTYAENQSLVGSSQQRVKERFQRIADRSWAE